MRTIAQQIAGLAGKVQSSDFAPTEQHRAVNADLRAELSAVEAEYQALVAGELAAFNQRLAREGMAGVPAGGWTDPEGGTDPCRRT